MDKYTSRHTQKRISKKRLLLRRGGILPPVAKARKATQPHTYLNNFVKTENRVRTFSATGVTALKMDSNNAKPVLEKKSKARKYFIGVAAVLCLGVLVAILANTLTFTLEIPDGGIKNVAILNGTPIAPTDFISPITAMDGIYVEFQNPYTSPIHQSGRHYIALTLRNGRRVSAATAMLYVLSPYQYIQIEAGTPISGISPLYFVQAVYIVPPGTVLDMAIHSGLPYQGVLDVGEHIVSISANGTLFYSQLNVVDTTPPTANLTDITIPMGQEVQPEDFIIYMFDMSPIVAVWFVYEPDLFTPGDQIIEIALKDYFHNTAVYSAVLTILPNTTPPQILGTRDINTQIGSTIMFRQGVTAIDAFGRPLTFSFDTSGLNIHEIGTYTVIYHTQDAWGLRAEVAIYVHVLDVDPELVRTMADAVLEGILQEGMTQAEQAHAIFDWISHNIAYAADVSRYSIYEGAYQGLRNRRGDCFVFYSVSEVLLTQAGIPNMHIGRIEGTFTRHSWNLINPDGLGWHHFDTTPLRLIFGQRLNRFMFTSGEARHHTQLILNYLGMRDYYTYYPELYPEIVQ